MTQKDHMAFLNSDDFSFSSLEQQLSKALSFGYKFLTCHDYFLDQVSKIDLTIVNRVDVDFSLRRAEILAEIFKKIGIRGTFFIRMHAPEYNPFSFDGFRIIKKIIENGNEIGLHTEVIDQSRIWNIPASEALRKDIDIFQKMFDVKLQGCACHGGITGNNNLDFFGENEVESFGLKYEAYGKIGRQNLFENSLYVSDSEWHKWKCFLNGDLLQGNQKSLGEHIENYPKLIYLLTHPDCHYVNNIYE